MGIEQNCDVRKELRKLENPSLLSQLLSDETRGFEKNISGSLTDGSLGAEEDLVTWPPLVSTDQSESRILAIDQSQAAPTGGTGAGVL